MQQWSIEFFLQELGIDYILIGQERLAINNVAPIDRGVSNDLSFCSSDDKPALESILSSRSGVILCKRTLINKISKKVKYNKTIPKFFVFVDNPRLVFIRIAKLMKGIKDTQKGISRHATIADSARIGRDCYIGAFASIGDDCMIGDHAVIDSKVVLKDAQIGNNCVIQSGNIIGAEGFAFERTDNGANLEKFPHFGTVVIENNVEVFANCTISRGSLSDTIIEKESKIDSLCHTAHNVSIGRNTQVTAGTAVGGSTRIGNTCWIGLNSTIKNKLEIGDNVIIGSGSSVIRDIGDKDIVAGSPAKTIKNIITLSEDKLFLMGGQKLNYENKKLKDH